LQARRRQLRFDEIGEQRRQAGVRIFFRQRTSFPQIHVLMFDGNARRFTRRDHRPQRQG
jgi:hypothetical protein